MPVVQEGRYAPLVHMIKLTGEYSLAENECREQPKTGNGDCEKETVGDEFIKRPHDRTPLFDQCIRTFPDK
jgi:hypothetical protein